VRSAADGTCTPLVLLDFDGTLAETNVAVTLLERFSPEAMPSFHAISRLFHAGRLTLREAWDRQAALFRAEDRKPMEEFVRTHVRLRPGARELLELLRAHSVPTAVVSGGFDFYIRALLEREGISLPVYSDIAAPRASGPVEVLHPHGNPECLRCGICKARFVRDGQQQGRRVVYVGDGATDEYAAETADIVFARRRLVELCTAAGIPFYPFEDLHPVRREMERWLAGTVPWPDPRRGGRPGSPCPISTEMALERPFVPGADRS
jgi:2-hydroxy-3-keto-5-methylthiopentenyl-1-phosphate phosphatase